MFSFLKKFLKKTFISFYIEQGIFYVQKLDIKQNKVINKENKHFKTEEEFLKFLKTNLMKNTQTYISTLIMNYNQGCVDSCSSKRYRELEIHTESVKIACINNKFSIYVGMLELEEFKRSMQKYHIDLIYSPYLIIELNKENIPKTLYILIRKEYLVLLIYTNELPEYSAIYDVNKEDENRSNNLELIDDDSEIEGIEEIGVDELENLDSLDSLDNLDDSTDLEEELEEESENAEELDLKEESDIKNFIKDSLKDYYENYANDFIENVYFLKTYNFKMASLKKELEDELLVKVKTKNIDLLSDINSLARKDVNV